MVVGIGAVVAALGLIALWNAVDASLVTTAFVGWLLIISGFAHLVGTLSGGSSGGSRILQGILGVAYFLAGLFTVLNPILGVITLTVALAMMLIVLGIARVAMAFTADGERVLPVVLGVIDILLGIWLWSGIPFSAVAIGFFVGLELLLTGILWIVAGMALRSAPDRTAGSTT